MLTYKETLDWLFSQLPMYQRAGKAAYKADLQNTIDLDNHLSNPHKAYKTIHLAGTNGKGSTSHMIASVLQEAGYKVGLYTSPHLKDFRERIRINGEICTEQFVIDFIHNHQSFFKDHQLSFFEMTVGMAFQYFKEENVDIAIIETGLGGRLDSTNIITPIISAITNIDKDHTAILGNTYSKIAIEKAGVIKNSIPVVIGEKKSYLKKLFTKIADDRESSIYFIDHRIKSLPTDLKGHYQRSNVRLASQIIELITSEHFIVSKEHLNKGLLHVAHNTGLRGRYDVINQHPKTILDTAHNVAGINLLINQIKKEPFRQLHIVLGMVSDKDADSVIKLLPQNAIYYISTPNIPRGMKKNILSSHLNRFNLENTMFNTVNEAFEAAKTAANYEDLILITGSTFVVSEII